MDDALTVSGGQRRGDARNGEERLADRETPVCESLREILSVEPLHRKEARPIEGLAVCDIRNDGGVLELAEDARLTSEALTVLLVAGRRLADLERDRLARRTIASTIDRAHASRTSDPFDLETIGEQPSSFRSLHVKRTCSMLRRFDGPSQRSRRRAPHAFTELGVVMLSSVRGEAIRATIFSPSAAGAG